MSASTRIRPGRLPAILLLAAAAGAPLAGTGPVRAQSDPGARSDVGAEADILAGWIHMAAPPTHESLATDLLAHRLDGWKTGPAGDLVFTVGSGAPVRVVACGLDRADYVVTRITPDGYLRLHTAGRVPNQPLWNGFHEGQQVRVLTSRGPVPAVVAIANAHFAFQHRADTALSTADDLWVDLGADSREQALAMGVRLLDPVVRRLPTWSYADLAAGPDAGTRTGCAALAAIAASGASPTSGRTVLVLSTEHSFGWVGLGAELAGLDRVDQVTLLGAGRDTAEDVRLPATALRGLAPVLRSAGVDSVRALVPAVLFPGTLVESVRAREADRFRGAVARAAGVPAAADATWPRVDATATPAADGAGSIDWAGLAATAAADTGTDSVALSAVGSLLGRLTELPAASGHERRVREAILAALPDWARQRARVDSAGNITVAFGPDRDTTVFMAHQDEVGWEVAGIEADGTLALRPRGGFYARAWEGQPALLYPALGPAASGGAHRSGAGGEAGAPLRGVFVPRRKAQGRRVRELRAWFGLDSAGLVRRGVAVGDQVLGYKEALRLGPDRLTARAEDDRAGDTALLLALRRLDPSRATRKLVFAWTVREEIGLEGARELARRLGRSTTRAYSVDTFVTSDTPLESHGFAYAPLGAGPVLRAAENSSLTPPVGRERVEAIARADGVPLQVGLTQGGTDGTEFTFWGAPNAGLSWPGRYSHSPVEVLDLRDVARLAVLVQAVAMTP